MCLLQRHKPGRLTFQWHVPVCLFLGYRILVSSYFLGWLIGSILYLEYIQTDVDLYPWPAYVNNLAYLALTGHLLVAAIIGLKHLPRFGLCHVPFFQEESDEDLELTWLAGEEILVPLIDKDAGKLPCLEKIDWLLFNVACTVGTVTTISYWTIFPRWEETWLPLDLQHHLVSLAVILLEMVLSAIPMRILHVIYPMIFGVAYVAFTLILWAVDGNYVIYPDALNWNESIQATLVACVAVFVFVPAVHLFFWTLFKMRCFVYRKICLDPNNNTRIQ